MLTPTETEAKAEAEQEDVVSHKRGGTKSEIPSGGALLYLPGTLRTRMAPNNASGRSLGHLPQGRLRRACSDSRSKARKPLRHRLLEVRSPPVARLRHRKAGSGSPTRKAPKVGQGLRRPRARPGQSALQRPLGPRRLPPGRQAVAAGRRAADLEPRAPAISSTRANSRYETATRYAYPQIGIDGKGRVWLTYRQKFGSRYSTHPGSYWLTFARRLDGDHWSEPIEVHHSDGLLDSPAGPAAAPGRRPAASSTTPTAATPRRRPSTTRFT